jgi:hypothetical protein
VCLGRIVLSSANSSASSSGPAVSSARITSWKERDYCGQGVIIRAPNATNLAQHGREGGQEHGGQLGLFLHQLLQVQLAAEQFGRVPAHLEDFEEHLEGAHLTWHVGRGAVGGIVAEHFDGECGDQVENVRVASDHGHLGNWLKWANY